MRVGVVFRYQKTATSDASVYTNNFGRLYFVATGATTAYSMYESIRIKRITVRSMGVVNNSAGGFSLLTNQITLRMDDGQVAPFGSERRYTDTATNAAGAVVSAKTTGLLSSWMNSNDAIALAGQRICTISGPQGAIVDVKCSIQFIVSTASAGTAMVVSGATAGKVYFNYLDNSSTSSTTAGTQVLQNINGANQLAAT